MTPLVTTLTYSKYKDSHVQWLGPVPAHWSVLPIRRVVADVREQTTLQLPHEIYVALEHVEGWTGRLSLDPNGSFSGQVKRFAEGDVLFGKLRPYLAKVHRSSRPGVCVGEFLVLRPNSADPNYLGHLLRSYPIIDFISGQTAGARMPRAEWHIVGGVPIPIPPLDEQQAIARFLDHQDRRINRFIRNKRRLIELLNEQKQAIIHQAVTRGRDPNVPLKPSGIDWLGNVPEHWAVRKLNQVARLESGHTPSRNKPEYWQNCIIPWVSLKDVGKLRDGTLEFIEDTEEKISELGLANSSARLLPAGTVILSRTASVGFSAILGRPMATTQDFVNWICSPSIEPRYLLQCLRAMRGKLGQLVMGSTHKTIYMPDLRSFMVPIPPLHEQMTIIDLVARDSAAIVGAVDRAKREIDLMREYRTRQ